MNWSEARWRKSSRSVGGNNAACVEVAFVGAGTALRDSKNPAGPVIVVGDRAWSEFLAHACRTVAE